MNNRTMSKEAIEMFKKRFIQENGMGINGTGGSECILFCKKLSPTTFAVQDGVAVLSGTDYYYHDGVCMVSNLMRVVFVLDHSQETELNRENGKIKCV